PREPDRRAELCEGRAPRRRVARIRLLHEASAVGEPRQRRQRQAHRARPAGRRLGEGGRGARRRPRGRPGERCVLEGGVIPVSFERPWLLLSLLVLALAVGLWLLADRRRARYTIRYTNLDVLASVAGGRSWTRFLAPALFGLALASLLVALA